MTRNPEAALERNQAAGEIDLRALGRALRRRMSLLVGIALASCLALTIFVNVVAPRYTAQSQVLLENQETFFTRPDRVNVQQVDQAAAPDPEAVASQVQLITSRDIALRAIKQLDLEGNQEFDPSTGALESVKRVLVLLGLVHDTSGETRDSRIVTKFLDKLVVYSPPKTRVITIEFTSRDPHLAARAANTVAELYLETQSSAKRQTAQAAADSLSEQISDLRARLIKADDAREHYRLQTGLLAGSNNMTISGQQLADINSDVSKARTAQADAQAKAQMIRDLLSRGLAADVPDVINNDTVRRIAEQRVAVAGQLALESRTLLPGHPRIKALAAQVQEYDRSLKAAAKQAATTLENEATIAAERVKNLEAVLGQEKVQAGSSDVDEIHLRALDRAAEDLKAQLESSTTKYQEALARAASDATPADARIIERAVAPQEPSFPKKLPYILFGTLAALALTVGVIVAGELIGAPVDEPSAMPEPLASADTAPTLRPAIVRDQIDRTRGRSIGGLAIPFSDESVIEDDLSFAEPSRTAPEEDRPSMVRSRLSGVVGFLGAVVERAKAFGQSAAADRASTVTIEQTERAPDLADETAVGWDRPPVRVHQPVQPEAGESAPAPVDHAAMVDQIVAAHVPGHGLHVVGVGVGARTAETIVDLARSLSQKGRSIVVDLNSSPTQLACLARSSDGAAGEIAELTGLAELLVGEASFAEVIHRDHASRLHFIPTGRHDADFRDFDLILDALTETYDFVVLLTPAFPQSDVAKIMAPYANFVVLAAQAGLDQAELAEAEQVLSQAGAREILVVGRASSASKQHVA